MLKFKPKKGFAVIDSDIYIDFVNNKVSFPNQRTIFDRHIIASSLYLSVFLDFIILAIFLLANPFSSPDFNVNFTLRIVQLCSLMFATIPLAYAYLLFMFFLGSPTVEKKIRDIKKRFYKNPMSRDVIEHPYRVKMTMNSSFELTFIGECADYREKVYYDRKNHTLEVTFTKPCEGQLIIETW